MKELGTNVSAALTICKVADHLDDVLYRRNLYYLDEGLEEFEPGKLWI
jgi:hypothetical protein